MCGPRCQAASGPPPGDVPRPLRPCPATVAALTKTYHYVMVTVAADRIGDGKIFVLPLEQAFRIRTGESGNVAIGP